jgi:CxxC motif-containing protein (DUF1111 family)
MQFANLTKWRNGWKPLVFIAFAGVCWAQTDPGPRGGAPGAGTPFTALTAGELDFFNNHGVPQFSEVEAVADGLGPRFNLNSCGGCHAQPALGGTSPATNPQFTANAAGGMAPGNTIPYFVTQNGPIREVRFIKNANGSEDGGVHDIFTIAGRADKPAGCSIQQPDFNAARAANNIIFRIPTPTFGTGLIEAITDTTIKNNLASDPGGRKAALGIKGHVNTNGNDGSVTRFGWKAQNKSLLIFAGEAYNVEMGVTSENFPNEREEDPKCATNRNPESGEGFAVGSMSPGDILAFMGFMKFLDQPKPACSGNGCSASIQNGSSLFNSIGCALCHTPTMTTGLSSTAALSQQPANLFSDLALHHMGSTLADGVRQGNAAPDEFRTAPLWGVGQRIFFLHDGRTSDLLQAIQAHSSNPVDCEATADAETFQMEPASTQFFATETTFFCGSEANKVIANFNALSGGSTGQKQDILNFLRSL